MSCKQMKKLRKLLNIKINDDYREQKEIEVGIRRIGVIDGVNGNHHIREEAALQTVSNDNRRLYRNLKKEFKKFNTIGKELRKDMQKGAHNE